MFIFKKNLSSKKRRLLLENLEGYLFISPWLFGFIVFSLWAMFASLYYSFTKWNILSSPQLIGLENYKDMFKDPLFYKSLRNTFYFTLLAVPSQMVVALGLALLLNQKIRGQQIYRTVYYLPTVISGAAVALLWMIILNPVSGVINRMLGWFGIEGPAWMLDPKWVIPALVLMTLWGVGGPMVIFLAALQGVPRALYEAAEIDGAGLFKRFIHITLPMISPVLFFNFLMAVIGSLKVFSSAFFMFGTEGGPRNSALFSVLYLFANAFHYFKMGYASALAWGLFIIILAVTLLVFKSSPLWVYYEGELKN